MSRCNTHFTSALNLNCLLTSRESVQGYHLYCKTKQKRCQIEIDLHIDFLKFIPAIGNYTFLNGYYCFDYKLISQLTYIN